jgi:drug/metabolite transporter (DMT)-like permease
MKGFAPSNISGQSAAALFYLALAGTVIGFAAYVWLLDNVSTALVSTYTFVNPVVAVLLGWTFLGEHPTGGMFLGAILVVASVIAVWLLESNAYQSIHSRGKEDR